HDLLGSSIHQEILRVQVRRVQRLLAETPLSVEQIAKASGFLNPKHMARVFREALDMTPSQYRAANQGGPEGYE
ncbi:MAG: helix-turn-helix domain-containing protein, partial [bacterium]